MRYETPAYPAVLGSLVGPLDLGVFDFDPRPSAARLEDADAALAAGCTLRDYVPRAWRVIEPTTEYVPGWHIDAICEHLEAVSAGQIRKLIINIPPRHMKSSLVGIFWPSWEWTSRPHLRYLCASYSHDISKRDAVRTRRLILSPWYQALWGDVYALVDDQNEKMRYETDKGGYRIATSVGGLATGEGGDRLVIDDPHKATAILSPTIRENDLDWWRETWSTRLNDPAASAEVIIMQRLHQRDLTGYILAEVGDYEHLCLPARYEPRRCCVTSLGWGDPRTEEGELLWPARFGEPELSALERKLGSYGTAGQLQQRPSPEGGAVLERDWWRYYTSIPGYLDEQIQSWDMAFKDTTAGSYVVGQVWGRVGADRYLLAQVRARMDFPRTLRAVRQLSAEWPQATLKLVEDKANGPAVIAALRHEISGLVPVPVQGSKEARAHAVAPEIEAGNVYLPDPSISPWIEAFVEECTIFPNGANDDQVDACTQALIRLRIAAPGEPDLDANLDTDARLTAFRDFAGATL